jgi:hypothetical protein
MAAATSWHIGGGAGAGQCRTPDEVGSGERELLPDHRPERSPDDQAGARRSSVISRAASSTRSARRNGTTGGGDGGVPATSRPGKAAGTRSPFVPAAQRAGGARLRLADFSAPRGAG